MKKTFTTLLVLLALAATYLYQRAEFPATPAAESAGAVAAAAQGTVEIPTAPARGPIVRHTGYTLAYDTAANCPQWVAWCLTADEAAGDAAQRTDDFRPDASLPPQYRVTTDAYRRSGYDRGHLCPAADMKWSPEAMADCFYMSNICPQAPVLNQRWWEHVERACRRWAAREGEVYVCCGPIFRPGAAPRHIGGEPRVRVPDAFFKVVLSLAPGREKAIAFLYANDASRQPMEQAATTVDSMEAVTGYDFFPALDDALETRLESSANLRAWD